jgi:hypothetical protein
MLRCERCGTPYEPKTPWQIYCTLRCRQAAYLQRKIELEAERLLREREKKHVQHERWKRQTRQHE